MTSRAHWTYRNLPQEMSDTSHWQKVDVDALDPDDRQRFFRLQSAIEAYIKTGNIRQISRKTKIAAKDIIRQLNRCLSYNEDGHLEGWRALIRRHLVDESIRRKALPVGAPGVAQGFACAFSAFLELHPNIRHKLDTLILKHEDCEQIHEARISAKNLHKTLVRLCEAEGLTRDDYPLNTRSCARRSTARYIQTVIQKHSEKGILARHGKAAAQRLKVGSPFSPHLLSLAPFDLVGADPHKLHCFGTVRIPGPAGPQRVPIERLWIVPVLENECRVILGYSVGIRIECNAATIEEALISSTTQWEPRKLRTPGMSYKPGAGFPSALFPELAGCGWVTLTIDNAAIHYSKAIAERARRRFGCFVTWGAIGRWDHRAVLERLMLSLEIYGFQRMPSSTGSSPKDSIRNDPVRKAVEIGIDWEDLLDLVDIVLADYNATQTEALGYRTPLNALRDHLHEVNKTFLPRPLPPPTAFQPELGVTVETRTIRGNRDQGRRPYVEIDRGRYTSPILANSMALIGKKLRVHIKGDFRFVTAYFESGEELGLLTVKGPWVRRFHTREMRKQVNALRDAGELALSADDDPVEALMRYYASKAYKLAEKNPFKVSKDATKLANIAHVTGHTIPVAGDLPALPAEHTIPLPDLAPTNLIKRPHWKTITK